MDRQNSRMITSKIRGLFVVLWGLFSTIFYGILCMFLSLFSRNIARYFAQIWSVQLLWLAGIKVTVHGKEKIEKNSRYVFVSNHQSGLDILILYANLMHNISFIAKKELFMIPVFGWGMYMVGHIWIDRGNARRAHASIQRAVDRLKRDNVSLVLFPEGTRSKDGNVGTFKQGAFSLALKAGVSVVPVAIRNACDLLPKKSLVINPGTVYLDIGDPVVISSDMTKAQLADQFHRRIKGAVENDGVFLTTQF